MPPHLPITFVESRTRTGAANFNSLFTLDRSTVRSRTLYAVSFCEIDLPIHRNGPDFVKESCGILPILEVLIQKWRERDYARRNSRLDPLTGFTGNELQLSREVFANSLGPAGWLVQSQPHVNNFALVREI